MKKKKLLLFVIDALADDYVRQKLHDAELPHLAELVRDGGQVSTCTSIFPSITPAATCSIVTGEYPATHGIQGAFWYDRDQHEFAYYGDDFRLIRKKGFERYLADFGHRLNQERLRCKTLFQTLAEQQVSTGCVNFMWYQGNTRHQRNTPWILRPLAGQLDQTVWGPDMLKLGDFVDAWPESMRREPSLSGGIFHRFGFSDQASMDAIKAMMEQDCLPEFTLAYLPQNDDLGHKVGPHPASDRVLAAFDQFLRELAKLAGGWNQLKRDYVIFIVGDHAQSSLLEDAKEREIKLDDLLDGFSLADADTKIDGEQLCYCANMRSAAIYQLTKSPRCHLEIADSLLTDPRIDQVIWQAGAPRTAAPRTANPQAADSQSEDSTGPRWHVRNGQGELVFWRASGSSSLPSVSDNFGNRWNYEGQLDTLGLRCENSQLVDGKYPNAMERIAGAYIDNEAKPLWVTAKAGHEFSSSEAHVNAAGSHASLTEEDSQSCFISSEMVGDPAAPMRIVDVFSACMQTLLHPKG